MSEDEAHHVSEVMKIIVKYHDKMEAAYVIERHNIGFMVDKVLSNMGFEWRPNRVFTCGGEVINKDFSFNFYKTLLWANGNVIQIIDRTPRQQLVKEISKLYDICDLHNIIYDLQQAEKIAHKNLERDMKAFNDFEERAREGRKNLSTREIEAQELREKLLIKLEKKQLPKKLRI